METDAHSAGKQTDRRPKARPALWMRVSVALLSPVAFLLLVELVLRLAGYGLPAGFFIRYRANDSTVYVANRDYCRHFVPKALSRAPEAAALRPKDSKTMRIFVLGGSAAFGDPDPAFGFCRQLQVLLNEYAASVSFEVVNAAVTSMNSHVARRIARDCLAHKPDAFIIFMGNNEVVGPYGPPTLPARLYASDTVIDLSIAAKRQTRLGQLIDRAIQAIHAGGGPEKRWQGMEAFLANQIERDDPKLQSCYRHFATNLRDIIKTAHDCGAQTVLCTVPTNIRSCAPFGSAHAEGLTEEQIASWDRHFQQGRRRQHLGDFQGALQAYAEARAIDADYADLLFSIGTCDMALDRVEAAKEAFLAARDCDTLRFRADTSIDRAIRDVARTSTGKGVTLLDLNGHLAAATEEGLLGESLLVDHVHLNFRGNFLAACAAMDVLRTVLPDGKLTKPQMRQEALFDLVRQRLIFDEREIYNLAMTMYRRKTLPPFRGRIDHEANMERFRQSLFAVYRMIKGRVPEESAFVQALAETPGDSYLTVRYGQFLVSEGRLSQAVQLHQEALKARPFDMKVRVALAKAMALSGMKEKAIEVLTSKEAPYPYDRKGALLALGVHYVQSGRIAEAREVYEELARIDPDNLDVQINLAGAASYAGRMDAMKQALDRAVALAPDSVQVMVNMGNYYAKKDEPAEAQKWFAKAVEADPQDHTAQIGLGIQSIRLRQFDKGIEHVTEAVELKPDLAEGYQILAAVYQESGQAAKAKKYAELRDLFQTAPSQ